MESNVVCPTHLTVPDMEQQLQYICTEFEHKLFPTWTGILHQLYNSKAIPSQTLSSAGQAQSVFSQSCRDLLHQKGDGNKLNQVFSETLSLPAADALFNTYSQLYILLDLQQVFSQIQKLKEDICQTILNLNSCSIRDDSSAALSECCERAFNINSFVCSLVETVAQSFSKYNTLKLRLADAVRDATITHSTATKQACVQINDTHRGGDDDEVNGHTLTNHAYVPVSSSQQSQGYWVFHPHSSEADSRQMRRIQSSRTTNLRRRSHRSGIQDPASVPREHLSNPRCAASSDYNAQIERAVSKKRLSRRKRDQMRAKPIKWSQRILANYLIDEKER